MNDFGALQELVVNVNEKINNNTKLLITLAFFVLINIIATLLDIYFQFKLKEKEKDINKHNIRETKRVDIQEDLYNMLEELTYFDGSNFQLYQTKSKEINKYLTKKRIYLNKDIIKITQEFNDYFLSVLSDYRNKDFQKEISFLERYSKIFNND
jgi:hypothetical protein